MQYLSVATETTRPLDRRGIRKNFSLEELSQVVHPPPRPTHPPRPRPTTTEPLTVTRPAVLSASLCTHAGRAQCGRHRRRLGGLARRAALARRPPQRARGRVAAAAPARGPRCHYRGGCRGRGRGRAGADGGGVLATHGPAVSPRPRVPTGDTDTDTDTDGGPLAQLLLLPLSCSFLPSEPPTFALSPPTSRPITCGQALQRQFPDRLAVAAVLAPKYPAEATATADADAGADAAVAGAEAALLVPVERPANAFIDPSLAAWKVTTPLLAAPDSNAKAHALLSLALSLTCHHLFLVVSTPRGSGPGLDRLAHRATVRGPRGRAPGHPEGRPR